MIMQEEELRQLLDSHGWYLITKERTGTRRNAVYLLAQKKGIKPVQQVHLTSRRELPIRTQEEILEKIGAAS